MPILYRVVESDPPTDRDFVSDRLRGHRHRLAGETDEEWDSFSAFTDLAKVQQTAAFLKQRRQLSLSTWRVSTFRTTHRSRSSRIAARARISAYAATPCSSGTSRPS